MSRFISDHEDATTMDGKTITVKYTEPKYEIRKVVYVAQESINEIADAVAKKLQPKAQITDAWEMFELITSVWFGKQCYGAQENGLVYSRMSCKAMTKDDAIREFLDAIGE